MIKILKKLIPIMKEDIVYQSLFPIIKKNTDNNSLTYKTQELFVRNITSLKYQKETEKE